MTRVNKQGQALGRKGEESRRRLLDATLSLLTTDSVHKLSASKIAREADMASQSFYLYFKDIDEILLTLAEEAAADVADIVSILRGSDSGATPEALSRDFIDAYSGYWDRHRPVLNARNYIADSGNVAFLKVRQNATMPMIRAIAERIRAAQPGGALTQAASLSRAVIIFLAIERLAARANAVQHSKTEASKEDLRRAEIDILTLLLTPVAGPNRAE